uniref:Uncharacterized protein n=1 Tax=Erpetoichthys calabaricus TaxID=27687 RepID=A0A8C4SSG8_ERPCA
MSSSSGSGNHSYDIGTKSGLTQTYNTPVFKAERVERAMGSSSAGQYPVSHSGVRVTDAQGQQWLIHKGGGYGISSQTVVVDAKHMSDKWKVTETKDFQGSKNISDFVNTGGPKYNVILNNCHSASHRMMNQK